MKVPFDWLGQSQEGGCYRFDDGPGQLEFCFKQADMPR